MRTGLLAWCVTICIHLCSATVTEESRLLDNFDENLGEILHQHSHSAFEGFCARLTGGQVRMLFDRLNADTLKGLLSKKCTSIIEHWELISTQDVEEGKLDAVSLNHLNIDSFEPEVLLKLLLKRNFLIENKKAFCRDNSLKKFLGHPSWTCEPKLMSLLDSSFMRQAISEEVKEPRWSKELFVYYNEMDFTCMDLSDMARWVIRSNQLLELLAADKVYHSRAINGNLKARNRLLDLVGDNKVGHKWLRYILSHPLSFQIQIWLTGFENVPNHGNDLKPTEDNSRILPEVTRKVLQVLTTHFRLKLTSGRNLNACRSNQQLNFPHSICDYGNISLSRSLDTTMKQVIYHSVAAYNLVEKYIVAYKFLDPIEDTFSCCNRNLVKYWHRQLLLLTVGSKMPSFQAHYIEMFEADFLFADDEARTWIECALSRGNTNMLDLALKYTSTVTIMEFLKHEIGRLPTAKRYQFFSDSENKMVRLFASLLPNNDDPIIVANSAQMIELKFTFDQYPDFKSISDPSHQENHSLFLSALHVLDVYANPFSHPDFMIAYSMQTGRDRSAIMNEWLLFVFWTMTNSDKRFFITTTHPIGKHPCLLPAEFVEPEIMRYFGSLIGKFWQKGCQLPMDLHPDFWHLLLDEKWKCFSSSLKKLLPSAHSLLAKMRGLSFEIVRNLELPLELSRTMIDSIHINYPESCDHEFFKPTSQEAADNYFNNWESELDNVLTEGREAFRSSISNFVDLRFINSDCIRWISSTLYENSPLDATCLVSRLLFSQNENVTITDDWHNGQTLSFSEAFICCLLKMTTDQLSMLLMFWTGSNRLPAGGYALLNLHVICLNSVSTGHMISSSCFKQLKCPTYPEVSTMWMYMVESIENGYNSGFEDFEG